MNSGKPQQPRAAGNPEPSRRYTAGRCRDYLSASVALNDRLERPAPHWGEEIVHSLRKRRGKSESLGPRFESERAHQFTKNRERTQFTVTLSGADAMPLATTASELAPLSVPAGTSNWVETMALPVATPMLL